MTEQHPIPPFDLFRQWGFDILTERDSIDHVLDCAWRDGFRTGADQELEACCEWTTANFGELPGQNLNLFRRPKPPSLKERALNALSHLIDGAAYSMDTTEPAEYIRRALEALPDD